jgi:biotin carboxylase
VTRPARARRGCIVDGISTGRNLAEDLRAAGIECGHVRSTSNYAGVPAGVGPYGYHAYFDGTGDARALLAEVRDWSPEFVTAGSEFGVALADRLSHELALPLANNPFTTDWRRNKYAMHERLAECGLAHAVQSKTSDRAALARWLSEHDMYPVVIKPLDSACSDGVSVCPDPEQALDAFDRIIGTTNRLGHLNREILAQEYLDGRQYFVNTVSREGRHFVSDIWRHDRRQGEHGRFLFENMVLQPRRGERETRLCDYTLAVLDALGIENGAAHCEVMWTSRGPVLIEAG